MRQGACKKIIIGMAVLIGFTMTPPISYATSSTQQKIDQATQQKQEVDQQINEGKEEVNSLKNDQKTLKGQLQSLNHQLIEISENLEELQQKIYLKEMEIQQTIQKLNEAQIKEAWQYDCMEQHIQFMYENGGNDYFTLLFNAKSFSSLLNLSYYIESIAEYDNQMLDEIIALREYIESEEKRLNLENEELNLLKIDAEAEKGKVSGVIGQTSNSIADYADQINDVEAEIIKAEAESKKLEEDIAVWKKQYEEELALIQQAANSKWRDISEVSFADGDRYLLANLIYCEAGGESYAGQLAVGAVVINRVLSAVYPETVSGVIYQRKQFSPVASGRLELALATNKATANCYKAADEAMSGITNVGNCLYFRTPIEGLTGITIGGHIFY